MLMHNVLSFNVAEKIQFKFVLCPFRFDEIEIDIHKYCILGEYNKIKS